MKLTWDPFPSQQLRLNSVRLILMVYLKWSVLNHCCFSDCLSRASLVCVCWYSPLEIQPKSSQTKLILCIEKKKKKKIRLVMVYLAKRQCSPPAWAVRTTASGSFCSRSPSLCLPPRSSSGQCRRSAKRAHSPWPPSGSIHVRLAKHLDKETHLWINIYHNH